MKPDTMSAPLGGGPLPKLAIDLHVYHAGVLAGVVAFIAFLGVIKDLNAILDPGGRGEVAWGFLMLRYSSLQRVWFGYRFTGHTAWLVGCAIPERHTWTVRQTERKRPRP